MQSESPRIPAVDPSQFDDEQAALAGGREAYNFTRVMVQHPGLYRTFIPFAEQLILRSSLPPRDREILILRTIVLCNETYEKAHHVLMARGAGLSDDEIAAIRAEHCTLSERFDQTLTMAVEELVRDHRVSQQTWELLAGRYSRAQLMELVFLVGEYTMISMATNSFGMQIEDKR